MTGEIRNAVDILAAPGGVAEVRALADGVTHSGYFDDYESLARAVEALDADPSVAGIYVTLNAVNPALLARRANRIKMRLSRKDATTADADILRRRWLPVDIDPVRPSGVSSTDEEHDAALEASNRIAGYLAEQGFPEPIRADSGNGAHLLYRIDLENDDAATALVKGVLTTLDALFSNEAVTVDTANHNAARIWKLYGTTSRKGDNTPERPHRRAKVLSAPSDAAIVPPERLQQIAGLLPGEEPLQRKKGPGIDLAAWLLDHNIAVRSTRPWQGGTLFTLAECPFSSAHRDGAFAIQFANGALFAGCHHDSCGGGAQRWPELRRMYERKRQKAEKEPEEQPAPPPPAADEHRERALAILRTGDPFTFLLDTFNKAHVGDRTLAECLVMSIASQSVENTRGLHVAISGNSGKGKSHACTTMLNLIPEAYKLTGTVSNKALYYADDLRPGTVLLFDDTTLSGDLQEVLKSATSSFREPIVHRTVTKDRQPQVCIIPERCVWWLARVEIPGDDQVLNRMLTVWIDDSAEQDRAVLEHLKGVEADGPTNGDDPDVLTCQALWSVLKEHRISVRIPFARRIGFSNAANRRNPGMLFDLIKCHAALRFLQLPGEEVDGVIRIEATREDFDAAACLYGAINQEIGSQESKLTRNEAAALRTISRMGWEMFTTRMLQQATGLSYHQVRRILQGYTAKDTTYCGLLEKCPALGVVDATVFDDSTGTAVRWHELHFQFDAGRYREWVAELSVWLEDEDPSPDGGCNPGCKGSCKGDCKEIPEEESQSSGERSENKDIVLHIDDRDQGSFATYPGAGQSPDPVLGGSGGSGTSDQGPMCDPGQVAKGEPECGSTPRDLVTRGIPSAETVCNPPCNSGHNRGAAGVRPLPGVLDPGAFERVRVELGRCAICGVRKAVYRSPEAQTHICEGCYSRLVREGNARAGVR